MQPRSNPRYSALVESFAEGCCSIQRAMYFPTVYAGPVDLRGAFHTPRTMSACGRSSHTAASVREVNVVGADTYLPSRPTTRARKRPEGNCSTAPHARRFRRPPEPMPASSRVFATILHTSMDRDHGEPQSHEYSTEVCKQVQHRGPAGQPMIN